MRPWTALGTLALAALARAQASVGGDQSTCDSLDAFRYQGCFGNAENGAHAGFRYLVNNNPEDPRYYPGFNSSALTIEMCFAACRGHGFRYAALFASSECFCSARPARTQTPLSDPANNNTLNECHVAPATINGCNGNRNEWCGSGVASDVYFDPSFPNVDPATQAANYRYIGCFRNRNPGIFYNDDSTGTVVQNTLQCLNLCANAGYAYAGMLNPTLCSCGSAFEVGQQALSESACNEVCTPGE